MTTRRQWRGDEEHPSFGRRAQAWLRFKLRDDLFTSSPPPATTYTLDSDKAQVEWEAPAVDLLLDWYLTDPMRYVEWAAADSYRGRGWGVGSWVVFGPHVEADLPLAVAHVDRTLDAEHCPTLDDWLRADIAGDLYYAGAPSGMRKVRPEHRRAHARVGASTPEAVRPIVAAAVCTECGRRIERRGFTQCRSCRDKHRAAIRAAQQAESRRLRGIGEPIRCGCGETFPRERANSRHCQRCRGLSATERFDLWLSLRDQQDNTEGDAAP